MSEKMKLVQNDTRPLLVLSITDENDPDSAPINLSGSTVHIYFREVGSANVKDTLTGVLLTGRLEEDGSITTTPPYDVAGVGGRVQFAWAVDTLDTVGDFEAEVEITFGDGTKQTSYDKLRFQVREQIA
jgi:hypothetical protein